MNRLFTLMVVALMAVGMVVTPTAQAPAEAHVVSGKTQIKKPEKLSGSVYRGWARTDIARSATAFDKDHIQSRRLVTYIEVRNSRTSPARMDSRTIVHEGWNRRFSSGPQRPNGSFKKGQQIRTVAVHTVIAPDVWKVGPFWYHGAPKRVDHTRRSGWVTVR